MSSIDFNMHIGSSAVLFATALLQAVCGSAVAETAEESSGRSLVRGGGGRMGDGGDARTMMSGSSFLQQAYRIQELQAEFHSQYSLFRCEYISVFQFWWRMMM